MSINEIGESAPASRALTPRRPSLRTLAPWFLTAAAVAAILAGVVPSDLPGFRWSPRICLLAAFGVTMVAQLVTTLWLHRGLTHGAVSYAKPVAWVMRFTIWILVGLKPWQWMYVHREHHLYEDTERDVHSPAKLGVMEVLFNNVRHYNRAAQDPEVVARWERFYVRDRWDDLFDRSFLGHVVGYLLAAVLAGPLGGLLIILIHPQFYVLLSGAVNSIGHAYGYKRKAGKPNLTGNSWTLAWLTWGEGLHDNHHLAPRSATMARGRIELLADPGYWVIAALARLRLATVLSRAEGDPGPVAHTLDAARMRREILRAKEPEDAVA